MPGLAYRNWTMLGAALLLAGCTAGGAERWAVSASNADLMIEGVQYRVRWLPAAGGYDFQAFRSDIRPVFMPDELVEKRRKVAAVMQKAGELGCAAPAIVTESRAGEMAFFTVRCG